MKLDDAQKEIRNGDVLLFEGTGLFSRLIQWKTYSRFSHVAVAIWIPVDSIKRLCVMEAITDAGVRMYPLDAYLIECEEEKCAVHLYQIVDDSIDRDKVAAYCLKEWGKRYSSPWVMLWNFGWLAGLIRKWMGKPPKFEETRFFCSELATAALKYAGFKPSCGDAFNPAEISPEEVALFPCLRRRGLLCS